MLLLFVTSATLTILRHVLCKTTQGLHFIYREAVFPFPWVMDAPYFSV